MMKIGFDTVPSAIIDGPEKELVEFSSIDQESVAIYMHRVIELIKEPN